MFRIGDMVYPISNEYVERVVRAQHDPNDLVGVVTEVTEHNSAKIEWLTLDRVYSAHCGLHCAWWDRDEVTYDRDEFLEAAFRAQEDMEWDFDPDDDNEGN